MFSVSVRGSACRNQKAGHLGFGFVSLTEALDLTRPIGRAIAGLPLPHDLLLVNSPVARIESKIQFEYVNARLAQESPLPVLGVLKHQKRDFSFRNLAFRSHAPNLELRRRWRDIRIEP